MDAGDLRKSPQEEMQTQTEVQGLLKVVWEVVEPKCQRGGAKEKHGGTGDLLEFQGDSVWVEHRAWGEGGGVEEAETAVMHLATLS